MKKASSKKLEIQATRLLKKAKSKRPSSTPTKWAVENRSKLLSKKNKAEEHIESCLVSVGLLYTREAPVRFNGKQYFMDFAVETSFGIVNIEVDGGRHMTASGQASDRMRDKAIMKSQEAVCVIRLSWPIALSMDRSIMPLVLWACGWPGSTILRY